MQLFLLLILLVGGGNARVFHGESKPICSDITSTSITVSFSLPQRPESDLFMVALHSQPNTYKPFAFWTTSKTKAIIDDLKPETEYYIRVLAHNASASSIVWHWFNATEEVACSTKAATANCPHSLRPVSTTSSSFSVSWEGCKSISGKHGRTTKILWCEADMDQSLVDSSREWKELAVGQMANIATIPHLSPNRYHHAKVVVFDNITRSVSESEIIRVRTQKPGTTYTVMQRISEYTDQIDFLDNHDSSSPAALVAFITANLGDNDFISLQSPITEYCVEHVDPNMIGGWADYISCNGPEAEPINNPEDPVCICDVYADRLIANQNVEEFSLHCANTTWHNDTHDDPPCFCTNGNVTSKWVVPEKSELYVGAMPVFLPYFYYQLPRDTYPNTSYVGQHFSTPKRTSCKENEEVGDNGCTWKRLPRGRVIYSSELLSNGWNATAVEQWPLHEHGPNSTDQTLQNVAVFDKTWNDVSRLLSWRCCGC